MDAEIIHAHTPYRVGYPAFLASRKLGTPFVYEVRGLWEDTAVANGRWRENGLVYQRFRRKETFLMSNADAVVCISEALKQDLVERGIEPNKIVVVPNGIEPHLLEHGQDKISHAEVLDFEQKRLDTVTIGYIGSLRKLEGVDYTAEAVSILQEKGYNVRFFVLTGLSGQKELLSYCRKLGISDNTLIFGPVPHDEVAGYYDLIDLFVVSRPKFRVTDLVTPLKPYEAMFHEKPIIAADLLAFREIIEHGVTGLLYTPDDVNSLAETLERCINEEGLIQQLSSAGNTWVLGQRSWDKLAIKYSQLYKTIIKVVNKMTKIFVTGGSGFIGTTVVKMALDDGLKVVSFDKKEFTTLHQINPIETDNLLTVKGSILNYDLLKSSLRGCDAVVHLAAEVSVPYSFENPEHVMNVNVNGTQNVINAAKELGIKKLILASSATVYGNSKNLPLNEEEVLPTISLC